MLRSPPPTMSRAASIMLIWPFHGAMRPGTSTTRIWGSTPGAAQRGDAVGAHRRRAERGGIDRARDHGDALGRNFVAFDHGARNVTRRRGYAVAAGERTVEPAPRPGIRRQSVGKRR